MAMGRDAEVFAAMLARADAAQLRDWSTSLLDEELQCVHVTFSDALGAMQRLQETQTRIATLEREQAAIGIFSGRTKRVMALVGDTQRLNEQLLSGIAKLAAPLSDRRLSGPAKALVLLYVVYLI
ncbi:hypothetical protein Gpo141_00009867 [Globisporangium polare]